jgi:hypothetical protein
MGMVIRVRFECDMDFFVATVFWGFNRAFITAMIINNRK